LRLFLSIQAFFAIKEQRSYWEIGRMQWKI